MSDSLPPELRFPDAADQDRLLAAVRRLIELQGYEPWVRAPILDSDVAWFPDDYPPGPQGARNIARRLMAYCGLADRRVILRVYGEANFVDVSPEGHGRRGAGAAAWFEGIDASECHFGINVAELRDPVAVIGSMCHEVAHAWRADKGIAARDPWAEEQSTDLTAVYLGFGVHLLNSSHTYRTGTYTETGEMLSFEHAARGYLFPGQIAVLLAAQVVARDAPNSDRKRIAGALSANQRMLFRKALELFDPDPVELRARIGVPEPPWPPPTPTDELIRPLAPDDDFAGVVGAPTTDSCSSSLRAVRVEHRRTGLLAVTGGFVPLFASLILLDFGGWVLIAAIVGAAVAGALVGHVLVRRHCSSCHAAVRRTDERCPGCGAELQEAGPQSEEDDEPSELESEHVSGPRCPLCGWTPSRRDRWQCCCGHLWDTFSTHGICPTCGQVWLETACLECNRVSPHDDWYGSGGG